MPGQVLYTVETETTKKKKKKTGSKLATKNQVMIKSLEQDQTTVQ